MAEKSSDLRGVIEVAQAYVGFSDQFLTEQLGRPYNVQEMAQFAESAIAALMASAYTNFRQILGKEAAEAWLKKTLSVAGSTVRLMGADALLRFEVHIKDMPNKLHQHMAKQEVPPSSEAAPAAAPAAPTCACKLSSNGDCPTCIATLSETFRGTFKFMHQMAEAGKKLQALCQVCHAGQTDRALSAIVKDIANIQVPPEHKEAFRGEMFALLHQIAGANGATAIPLTEKAWKAAVNG